jgi:hypothetical protein
MTPPSAGGALEGRTNAMLSSSSSPTPVAWPNRHPYWSYVPLLAELVMSPSEGGAPAEQSLGRLTWERSPGWYLFAVLQSQILDLNIDRYEPYLPN